MEDKELIEALKILRDRHIDKVTFIAGDTVNIEYPEVFSDTNTVQTITLPD